MKSLVCPVCKEEREHVIRDRWEVDIKGEKVEVLQLMFSCRHKIAMEYSTYMKMTEGNP